MDKEVEKKYKLVGKTQASAAFYFTPSKVTKLSALTIEQADKLYAEGALAGILELKKS